MTGHIAADTARRAAVFTNVVFQQYGNQSVRNFVQGLLEHGCEVSFFTCHRGDLGHMHSFADDNPGFRLVPLLAQDPVTSPATVPSGHGGGSWVSAMSAPFKETAKSLLRYRRYASNSDVFQWYGIRSTQRVLRRVGQIVDRHERLLRACDLLVFIDAFGGLMAKYLRRHRPSFWAAVADKAVGYYLGTVLHQFRGNNFLARLVMPISFAGSYRVPYRKIIMTDDGTNGEHVFREHMGYHGEILFIRNGVDQRLLGSRHRENCWAKPEGWRFVVCSRLTPWKRVDRAIRFVHHLRTSLGREATLTIVGDGEEERRLKTLVRELNAQPYVTFHGNASYEEAVEIIASHNFYVIFNDLSCLGNQVYEAVLLGAIPVTIDDGSTDSVLVHGRNSLKFPLGADFERVAAENFARTVDQIGQGALRDSLRGTGPQIFPWTERNQREWGFMRGADRCN